MRRCCWSSITEIQEPSNVSGIRRFLCIASHLDKCSTTPPLRDLLMKENPWTSGETQQRHDPLRATTVFANTSTFGLGAVLQQSYARAMRPVVYTLWALSSTEQSYTQIENESSVTMWALEKSTDCPYGIQFHVETDLSCQFLALRTWMNLHPAYSDSVCDRCDMHAHAHAHTLEMRYRVLQLWDHWRRRSHYS